MLVSSGGDGGKPPRSAVGRRPGGCGSRSGLSCSVTDLGSDPALDVRASEPPRTAYFECGKVAALGEPVRLLLRHAEQVGDLADCQDVEGHGGSGRCRGGRACAIIMSKSSRKCQASRATSCVVSRRLRQHRHDRGTRCPARLRDTLSRAAQVGPPPTHARWAPRRYRDTLSSVGGETGEARPSGRVGEPAIGANGHPAGLYLSQGSYPRSVLPESAPPRHDVSGTRSTLDTVSTEIQGLTRRAVPESKPGSAPSSSPVHELDPHTSRSGGGCACAGSTFASRYD